MKPIVGGLLGLLLGSTLLGAGGLLFGIIVGVLFGMVLDLRDRLKRLEAAQANASTKSAETSSESPVADALNDDLAAETLPTDQPTSAPIETTSAPNVPPVSDTSPTRWYLPADAPAKPDPLAPLFGAVRDFFTRGNLVVKIGAIILFFGVSFLLKYAIEHDKFPIELRFLGAALGALGLLVLGWRLRTGRRDYALVIQGTAVGILYLTVFAAAKLYHLVPIGFAFGIMLCLVVLSGILAILQDARALAAFGAAGGFLAPVLLSTGGGSHVMLFSYYAVLNAGILGTAWFKSWRELNLLGFVFTFVVAALWGNSSYRPELFASTEPFLILFFLFYVAIAVLFAHRQPPQLKGYVDGSLVFGVPLVGFSLQIGLVRDMEYGLAISALVLSMFYLVLARALWRRQVAGMRTLTEAFLALGVVFGSLAVPLALDGNWTAATWALEGAALVWVGIRQRRVSARLFGLLLQLGAGLAFLSSGAGTNLFMSWNQFLESGEVWPRAIWNAYFLGSVVVGLAGLISSYFLYQDRDRLRDFESPLPTLTLAWGLLWWTSAGLHESFTFLSDMPAWLTAMAFVAVSGLTFATLTQRLAWPALGQALIGVFPLLLLLALGTLVEAQFSRQTVFSVSGLIVWIAFGFTHLLLLRRFDTAWPLAVTRGWHALGFLLLVLILTHQANWWIHYRVHAAPAWTLASAAMVPILATWALLRLRAQWPWPLQHYAASYLYGGAVPILIYLGLWNIKAASAAGSPVPLAYLPVLNPLDLAQILSMVLALIVWRTSKRVAGRWNPLRAEQWFLAIVGGLAFLWLSVMVARTVHAYAGVSYHWSSLSQSVIFQTGLTITWSTVALIAMVLAATRGARIIWFVGAGLLGIVVAKLFLVDLTGIGTVARIISFLGVGALMLVVGYLSPLPPRRARPKEARA